MKGKAWNKDRKFPNGNREAQRRIETENNVEVVDFLRTPWDIFFFVVFFRSDLFHRQGVHTFLHVFHDDFFFFCVAFKFHFLQRFLHSLAL